MTKIKYILLIGRSGCGKSTLANVLSGTDEFKESSSSVAETRHVQAEEFESEVILGGNVNLKIKYCVIDTIGIGDTSLGPKEVLAEIAKAYDFVKDGLYQVFFVTGSRFNDGEIEAYNLLKDVIFDNQIVKYTTIVRTNFDDFEKEDTCSAEKNKLSDENSKAGEFIKSCNGILYVDNPPLRGRYIEMAREAREESRKRMISHLMINCGNYLPVSLSRINERIDKYKTKEEILKELEELFAKEAKKSNYWKEKYDKSCSIS